MAKIHFENMVMSTNGEPPEVGSQAPDFTLTDEELFTVKLSDFKDEAVFISTFLSVDLNYFSDNLELMLRRAEHSRNILDFIKNKKVNFISVSMDLPFSLKRFLLDKKQEKNIEKPDNFNLLSDFRTRNFGACYGLTIMDGLLAGLLARSIIILDKEHTVVYSELVKDLLDKPDFKAIRKIVMNL